MQNALKSNESQKIRAQKIFKIEIQKGEHVKETESKARDKWNIISKQNVRQKEIRAKIKLFETCVALAALNGFEAWLGQIPKRDGSNRKNIKSVIKENTTATSNNKTMTQCDKKTMTSMSIFHVA